MSNMRSESKNTFIWYWQSMRFFDVFCGTWHLDARNKFDWCWGSWSLAMFLFWNGNIICLARGQMRNVQGWSFLSVCPGPRSTVSFVAAQSQNTTGHAPRYGRRPQPWCTQQQGAQWLTEGKSFSRVSCVQLGLNTLEEPHDRQVFADPAAANLHGTWTGGTGLVHCRGWQAICFFC